MGDEKFDKPPSYFEAVGGTNQLPLNHHEESNIPPSYNDALAGAVGGSPSSENTSSYGWTNDLHNTTSRMQSLAVSSSSQSQVTRPDYSQRTVIPYDKFNVKDDIVRLANALKLDDKQTLIDILCQRSFEQRKEIAEFYESNFGIRLAKNIKNDISSYSDFSVLMCGLTIPFTEFLARAIHNSNSFKWICYIMCTITVQDRSTMTNYFETKYRREVIRHIESKIYNQKNHPDRHIFTQIKRCLLSTRGFYNSDSDGSVETSLRHLLKIQECQESKEFIKSVFYHNSFEHLKLLIDCYERTTGKNIKLIINSTYSNNAFVFENIIMYIKTPSAYFAFVLYKSMKGLGTDTILLSSAILMRCEIDMVSIKEIFKVQYQGTLRQWIKDDTSGFYKYALYKLIGEERSWQGN